MLDLSLPRNRMDRIRSELSHCSGECYKIQIADIRLTGKIVSDCNVIYVIYDEDLSKTYF